MDYFVYAYLQKAENNLAKQQNDYLKTIDEVYPVNFKDAYAFAAIPARYLLENKMWKEAATMKIHPVTPGEVIPARELLGDMLLQSNKPGQALKTYEVDLKRHPNWFHLN